MAGLTWFLAIGATIAFAVIIAPTFSPTWPERAVSRLAQSVGVAVGPSDEEGDGLDAAELPAGKLRGQFPRSDLVATLIERDAKRAGAALEQGGALHLARAGF